MSGSLKNSTVNLKTEYKIKNTEDKKPFLLKKLFFAKILKIIKSNNPSERAS